MDLLDQRGSLSNFYSPPWQEQNLQGHWFPENLRWEGTLRLAGEGHTDTWKDGQTIQSLRAGFQQGGGNVMVLAHFIP